jgi:hypothetical protein
VARLSDAEVNGFQNLGLIFDLNSAVLPPPPSSNLFITTPPLRCSEFIALISAAVALPQLSEQLSLSFSHLLDIPGVNMVVTSL